MKRILGLALATAMTTSMIGTAALAAPNDKANPRAHEVAAQNNGKAKGKDKVPDARTVDVQLLHFSDFHGHLEAERVGSGEAARFYGGAAYLAGMADQLEAAFDGPTFRVNSGDSIGGSTFVSGIFQDEPTIHVLNAMGIDASSVGNHEFDEGVEELMRIVNGGNHPELGGFDDEPYPGTNFPYLAANVVWKDSGEPILPPYVVQSYKGVKVGFIGVVTSETDSLVSPAGITEVDFLDEATTLNRYAAELQAQGVETIVALTHEGGFDAGTYPSPITAADVNAGCGSISGPILDINADTTAAVDAIMTGHTHNAYVCQLTDPAGQPRQVNSSGDWARIINETTFKVDRKTKDVIRTSFASENHVITPDGPVNTEIEAIVDEWVAKAAVPAAVVVGSVTADITGDAISTNRASETPMADLIADSILWGTQDAGAQISFMNVAGVRDSLLFSEISNGEAPGEVTFQEAYNVMPFSNFLVTFDMTGAQIEAALNQQFDANRGRNQLALGVSEGFTYTWDATNRRVVPGSMTLNGVALQPGTTYRVSTISFLADGGDRFFAFANGAPRTGGAEDLANFVAYLGAESPVSPPADRVPGI
ncbi:bifunctional metallophosphatase/5'-nucleotidase [Ornithinimicrobium cerasi]|uniref:5'-nucleotidase n=1 Tax=Ornithinimicrobium cerasi TaxID=2248773 RepID=A0A285VVJ5_9MICO|nr:bifunctional metallophosphatase/5'-nucleotidase [Ornithinimicrobium cerasi]SOC57531.1 5'-nucleotidase [Ornithinimicrobium cerasi]SOC57618.1 5'-nucleotidase [Ornithinimicrobium cerasi]